MKITRLKKGYRINLSDGEFAALFRLAVWGEGEYEGLTEWDLEGLEPAEKRGLKTLTRSGAWALDEDRRATGEPQ